MTVGYTFRGTGRAARECDRARVALVDDGIVERGVARGGDERVVVVDRLAGGRERGRVALADDDHVLHRGAAGQDRREEGKERRVDEDDEIFGRVRDEDDLRRRQADVQRVEHRAHRGHGHVGLEVLLVVPHERADALVGRHAETAQRVGELRRALAALSKRRLPRSGLGRRGDDRVAVYTFGVANEGGDRERRVHHRAAHGLYLVGSWDRAAFRRAAPLRESAECRPEGSTPNARDRTFFPRHDARQRSWRAIVGAISRALK